MRILLRIIDAIRREWHREERDHMRRLAHEYFLRAQMEGHVIRKTGEIVPKQSV